MKTTTAFILGFSSLLFLAFGATPLAAAPITPPHLAYDFPDLDWDLYTGQSVALQGSISNTGGDAVGFRFEVEYIAEPQGGGGRAWCSVEPVEGQVAPGEQVEVTITFSAVDLPSGDYEADLHILTNDPEEPDVVAMAALHVTGRPIIELAWSPDMGYPDSINWNGGWADLFPEGPYEVALSAFNRGNEALGISEISVTPEVFSVQPAALDIQSGDSVAITITFESQEAGEFNGTLTIVCDDPLRDRIEIPLYATAAGPPVAGPFPDPIDESLVTGEIVERELVLENQGDAVLRFMIETEIISEPQRDEAKRAIRSLDGKAVPQRDDAGDQLGAFGNWRNEYKNAVWDTENEMMWLVNYTRATADAYTWDGDYENFQNVARIQPGQCMDGAWARGLLYLPVLGSNRVNRWNPAGQNIGAIQFPFQVIGLAADDEEGWLMAQDAGDQSIHVYPLDDDGAVGGELGVIRNHLAWHWNEWGFGLEWVNAHPDGQFWLVNRNSGHVYEILVDTDNWECLEEVQNFLVFPNGDQPWCSVAHDGTNLWAGGFSNPDYRIYDDGIEELRWIRVEPTEGSIEPGESMVITITLNTTGLIGGDYTADLHVLTNDPANPDMVYEVHMWVTHPWIPMIWWPEHFGWPDVLDFNRAFQFIFVGVPVTLQVRLYNTGTEALTVDEAYSDNGAFRITPTEAVLEADEEQFFDVIFLADDPGEYDGVISLPTNDVRGELQFYVHATATLPPQINQPDDISARVIYGDTAVRDLVISNSGECRLYYQLTIEERDGRDGEANQRSIRSLAAKAPNRDDAGDLLGHFEGISGANQYCTAVGWDWDNERMWISNYSTQTAVAYTHDADYQNFDEVIRINPGACLDGCWADGVLFLGSVASNVVNRYSADGQSLGGIQFPYEIFGLAADTEDEWLFVLSAADANIYVYNLDGNGWVNVNEEVGVIRDHRQYHANFTGWGLEWVPKHSDGKLWMTSANNGFAHEISVDTDSWTSNREVQAFQVFPQGDHPYCSVAHDGKNLWSAGYGANDISIYDDGISEDPNWLSADPRSGFIEPDADATVQLTLDARAVPDLGWYRANVHILSNDPVNPEIVVAVEMYVWIPDRPRVEPSNVSHSVLVSGVEFDGEQVPSGWEVGVLTPGGVLCGVGRWSQEELGIAVWGADQDYPDYFHAGERMNFKLWDPYTDTESDAVATVAEGSLNWQDGGYTVLSLSHRIIDGHVVSLRQGWNLISFNFIPVQEYWRGPFGPDLRLLFRQFRNDQGDSWTSKIVLIKDEHGRFFAIRGYDFNMIPFWNLTEGYQVLASEACEGEWIGQQIPPDADIPIDQGWNFIAYYPTYQLSASRASNFYVLSPILDHVLIAKDDNGHFMVPASNFSNMEPWREGRGYQVMVNAAVTLNYPAEQNRAAEEIVVERELEHFKPVSRTGRNMSVIVNCKLQIENCSEIAVFMENGLCIGASSFQIPNSKFQIGLAVWGDDPSTEEIDGAVEGEALEFRLWDGTTETVVLPTWTAGKGVYETDGFAQAEIKSSGGASLIPTTLTLYSCSPNPFNSTAEIRYALPEAQRVRITLCDLEGRETALMVDGMQAAGQNSAILDGSGLAAGSYFVRLTAGRENRTAKVLLVK